MNFHVMTLFPEMITQAMEVSITGRAIRAGLIHVDAVNIRDFACNKHNRVDDYPYGGGAGMVMQAEPVYLCYQAVRDGILRERAEKAGQCPPMEEKHGGGKEAGQFPSAEECQAGGIGAERSLRVVYLSPQGETFHQGMAQELSREEDLVLLCGHYEGIDERVLEEIVTDYVSIGDYVLTGGELPALVMMDAISRLVPGVLNNDTSAQTESFCDSLLEYPQYTRPEEWRGKKVPPTLLSGNHKLLARWYREQSILRTARHRPDLLEQADLSPEERAMILHLQERGIE